MKKMLQKIIVYSYLFIFYFLAFGIAGNIELDRPVPIWSIILFILSGISIIQVSKNGGYEK